MTKYRTYLMGKDAVFYDTRALDALKKNMQLWYDAGDWLRDNFPTLAAYLDANALFMPELPATCGQTISFAYSSLCQNGHTPTKGM